ncbi:hypothetical protein D3C76_1542510 [compost metagenome]
MLFLDLHRTRKESTLFLNVAAQQLGKFGKLVITFDFPELVRSLADGTFQCWQIITYKRGNTMYSFFDLRKLVLDKIGCLAYLFLGIRQIITNKISRFVQFGSQLGQIISN